MVFIFLNNKDMVTLIAGFSCRVAPPTEQNRRYIDLLLIWNSSGQTEPDDIINAAGRRHAHCLIWTTVSSHNDLRCPDGLGSAARAACASSDSRQVSFFSHDARALKARVWLRRMNAAWMQGFICISFSCLDRPSRVVGISQESRVLLVVRVIRASIRRIPNVCGELQ